MIHCTVPHQDKFTTLPLAQGWDPAKGHSGSVMGRRLWRHILYLYICTEFLIYSMRLCRGYSFILDMKLYCTSAVTLRAATWPVRPFSIHQDPFVYTTTELQEMAEDCVMGNVPCVLNPLVEAFFLAAILGERPVPVPIWAFRHSSLSRD